MNVYNLLYNEWMELNFSVTLHILLSNQCFMTLPWKRQWTPNLLKQFDMDWYSIVHCCTIITNFIIMWLLSWIVLFCLTYWESLLCLAFYVSVSVSLPISFHLQTGVEYCENCKNCDNWQETEQLLILNTTHKLLQETVRYS